MTLSMTQFVIVIAAILFVLVLIIFPSFRQQLKSLVGGFLQIFVQDRAKTPDGARAIYAQKIDEQRDRYNSVCASLDEWAGKLKTATDNYERYKRTAEDCDKKARTAMAKGDIETAKTFAQTRQESLDQCENLKAQIDELTPVLEEAKSIKEIVGNELRKLERESKDVVSQIEMNNQMEKAYSDLDKLRSETGTDKLLKATREGVQQGRERASGARVNYQTSREGKQVKADTKVGDYEIQSYLDSISRDAKTTGENKTIKK